MSKVLAVILAGGRGAGLSVLTEERSESAVPFGGKYRIIDFVLSNCVNSGIYDVAVLTQYQPQSLRSHIGLGKPWDLDRRQGGVRLLQPFIGRGEAGWQTGTADAVYRNLDFIMESRADYVLVLAGDHIYRMDYSPMIAFHEEHGAEVTLGAAAVRMEESQRFGILETDVSGKVISFEEKPARPKGTLGSMGIYVFDRITLARVLVNDARLSDTNLKSRHDFGSDIIPGMLAAGEGVYAYPFTGYWQDVGTIHSYWEAHMELLEDPPAFALYDPSWVIHTLSEERPPAHLYDGVEVVKSLISHGCIIKGRVEQSVLSPGVIIEEGAVVRDSIVLVGTVIGAGSTVDHSILDKEVVIGKNSRIGHGDDFTTPNKEEPERLNSGITLVGKRTHLPDNLTVGRNCKIGTDLRPQDFPSDTLQSGETVESSPSTHSWERQMAGRIPTPLQGS